MPKLMRRHVNAEMPHDGVGDLSCEGALALATAALRNEKIAVNTGAKARQYMTAIPSKAVSNLVGDFADNVLSLRLCVAGCNVKEQLLPRTIRFAEVVLPAQRAQVLRSERQGK